ncbi:hypothetical protein M885DRAFT_579982 [Pelagophyceae sp. CCMP2097]|nr:hypothetical protein M885DRAFT_579982 [Pelagophyceae sp. CCMP2097]
MTEAPFPNTSWAEALGMKPDDFHACALEAKLIGKGDKVDHQRIGATELIRQGITRRDLTHGKNEIKNHQISWACAGPAPANSLLDQLEGREVDGTGDCWEDDSASDVNYDANSDFEYELASGSEEDMKETELPAFAAKWFCCGVMCEDATESIHALKKRSADYRLKHPCETDSYVSNMLFLQLALLAGVAVARYAECEVDARMTCDQKSRTSLVSLVEDILHKWTDRSNEWVAMEIHDASYNEIELARQLGTGPCCGPQGISCYPLCPTKPAKRCFRNMHESYLAKDENKEYTYNDLAGGYCGVLAAQVFVHAPRMRGEFDETHDAHTTPGAI